MITLSALEDPQIASVRTTTGKMKTPRFRVNGSGIGLFEGGSRFVGAFESLCYVNYPDMLVAERFTSRSPTLWARQPVVALIGTCLES